MEKPKKSPWVKLTVIVAVLAAIFLTLRYFNIDFSNVSVESFKEKIDSFGVWGPVIYIVFYLIRPLILFPAGILSASAGVIWGTGKGFMIVQLAAYISAAAEFFIARYFARDAVEGLVKGKMKGIDTGIEKNGFLTVLLIRLIPNVAWDIQNLGLGVTKVKFRDYALATLIGIIPGSFVFVYFGSSLISVLADPRNFWKIIVAFLIFGLVYFMQKKLRAKKEEKIVKAVNGQ